MDSSNRRKMVLINRQFQLRLIGKFVLINIVILIMFGAFLYLFLDSELEANLRSAHVTYRNIKEMLFPIVLTLSIINILVSSIIISVFVMHASHRVAGPLYRFNEAIEEMTSGNLRPTTSVRGKDQLYDCSVSLKNLTDVFTKDFRRLKTVIAEAKVMIERGETSGLAGKVDELKSILEKYRV